MSVIISDDSRFERFVVFRILEHTNHGFGGEAVTNGIAAGALFACFGQRAGALARVAAVGLDLPEGRHRVPDV